MLQKTIKLTEATFNEVAEFLEKKHFYAQNPSNSMRKVDSNHSFDYWKQETLGNYPNSSIIITHGGEWFNQVRVTDPIFQEDKKAYSNAVAGIYSSK